MLKLKILNRKIVKQGESHFIYIPKAYFDNGQLDLNEIYEITIVPQKKEKTISNEKSLNTETEA